MPTVVISRSNEYTNRLRKIKLFLDGHEVASISNGEVKTVEVAAGNHRLQAKIDWCTSNQLNFTVVEGATIYFSITSFAKHNPLGIFAAIYYITFGTKKYLHLEEDNRH